MLCWTVVELEDLKITLLAASIFCFELDKVGILSR